MSLDLPIRGSINRLVIRRTFESLETKSDLESGSEVQWPQTELWRTKNTKRIILAERFSRSLERWFQLGLGCTIYYLSVLLT